MPCWTCSSRRVIAGFDTGLFETDFSAQKEPPSVFGSPFCGDAAQKEAIFSHVHAAAGCGLPTAAFSQTLFVRRTTPRPAGTEGPFPPIIGWSQHEQPYSAGCSVAHFSGNCKRDLAANRSIAVRRYGYHWIEQKQGYNLGPDLGPHLGPNLDPNLVRGGQIHKKKGPGFRPGPAMPLYQPGVTIRVVSSPM